MTIRITYGHPKNGAQISEQARYRHKRFDDLHSASSWILVHISEAERDTVRLWIGDVQITGAARESVLRCLPQS